MARGWCGSVALARELREQRRRRHRQGRRNAARARAIRCVRPVWYRTAARSAFARSVRRLSKRTAKVAVAMGGSSAEREISLLTGEGVLKALRTLGYDADGLDY